MKLSHQLSTPNTDDKQVPESGMPAGETQSFWGCGLEFVQDFLIKLDIKPCMHLVEISIFSLNLVIVRLMYQNYEQKIGHNFRK